MDYNGFRLALRRLKLYIFTFEDVKNIFPGERPKTIKNNFNRWLSRGYFVRLKRGLYEFVDNDAQLKAPDVYVANRLYEPSYVSLETALSIYSVIPEVAAAVTSITTGATREFKNRYGLFLYRTCTRRAFTGYRLMKYGEFKVRIADKEKALVDFIYYRLRSGGGFDFEEERFNKRILTKIDWKKALRYAGLFNKKTKKALKVCKERAKC